MTKKLYGILVLGLILIFIGGCTPRSTTPETINYHSGNLGITLNLMVNSPPTNAYEGNDVPFYLEIRNQGAHDTSPKIWLSGHDPDIINVNWNGVSVSTIPGKSPSNPIGGYETLQAPNVQISLPDGVDAYSTNMKLTTCYGYVTQASAIVCVDPDPTNNQDDACAAKSVSLSGGQGGPVAITNIRNEPSAGGSIMFTITISNVGGGTIIDKGRVGTCTTKMTAADIDTISIASARLGKNTLTCTPQDPVRLVNGKGTIYCRQDGLTGSAYTTTMNLDISYGYKSSISRSMNVRRI